MYAIRSYYGEWSGGFLVFENSDRDEPPELDDGEILLHRHLASPSVKITANRRGFTLRATFLRATNGTLVVCDRAGRVTPRALVISYTGRPRITSYNVCYTKLLRDSRPLPAA